jgi:hypothetical protein
MISVRPRDMPIPNPDSLLLGRTFETAGNGKWEKERGGLRFSIPDSGWSLTDPCAH